MARSIGRLLAAITLTAGCLLPAPAGALNVPKQNDKGAGPGPNAWTFDEALDRLVRQPRDAYLQYVVLQLARRDDRLAEGVRAVAGAARISRPANDRSRAGLFSLFTGAAAVQESLQLDAMRGGVPIPDAGPAQPAAPDAPPPVGRDEPKEPRPGDPAKQRVKVADLRGPTVQSHPWDRLLAGRRPDVGPLAPCVPDDYYFAEFRSTAALTAALAAAELGGNYLLSQVLGSAQARQTAGRVQAQLGLAGARAADLDGLGVTCVAAAGSDLYLGEGGDATLLFHSTRPDDLRAHLDGLLAKSDPDAWTHRTQGTYLGRAWTHTATADRALDVYAADLAPGVHARSNSLVALQRVLEAAAGRDPAGRPARRLGEAKEFAYLRTLMPRQAPEEDGFVYLSDPFIRRLVGPALKLKEARRSVCHNHLRMIGHACLLFRTEYGRPPASFDELARTGCAPGVFGRGELACPDGGVYRLTADGMAGFCSRHGSADRLTPCCELPLDEVSGVEAEAYRQFVKDYSEYWKTYFDPVAVRIRSGPEHYRLETVILPLLDHSVYTSLATALGGKEVALDSLPVSKRTIFTVSMKVNKEPYRHLLPDGGGTGRPASRERAPSTREQIRSQNNLKEIGLAIHNYEAANGRLPADILDKRGKPLLSWRVAVLPYLGQNELYQRFKLDEPWDSEHNKKLLARMPEVYRAPGGPRGATRTPYLAVAGPGTAFPPGGQAVKLTDISDGLSNTIFVVEAVAARSADWSKPEDFVADPKKPLDGLSPGGSAPFNALMGDGSVTAVRADVDPKALLAAFTASGGEPPGLDNPGTQGAPATALEVPGLGTLFGLLPEGASELKARRFVMDGLGDQVAFNVHDSARLFDFDWAAAIRGDDATGVLAWLVYLLTSSWSVGVPVKDARVVDEFLDQLDAALLEARPPAPSGGGLFNITVDHDFYRTRVSGHRIRCASAAVAGLKVRLFWGRVGGTLYVVNKPAVLDDVVAAEADRAAGRSAADADGPRGHALIRVRPRNWDQVLAGYRLGWAESDRRACAKNLTALENVARGWNDRRPAGAGEVDAVLLERTARLYGTRPFCPEAGRYRFEPDGRTCRCGVHGSPDDPSQPAAPTEASAAGRLLQSFRGLTATLSFTEDGLRAVLTVDRRGSAAR